MAISASVKGKKKDLKSLVDIIEGKCIGIAFAHKDEERPYRFLRSNNKDGYYPYLAIEYDLISFTTSHRAVHFKYPEEKRELFQYLNIGPRSKKTLEEQIVI